MKKQQPIEYRTFKEHILNYNEDEFQDFCHRYERLFYVQYRATLASPGDLANDGIMTTDIRGAYYALHRDTEGKGNSVATKMQKDFENMVKQHPQVKCMIFMTRTEGLYPHVQKRLEKLRSEEYQNTLMQSLFPQGDMKQQPLIGIEYLGMDDMFWRLSPFKKEETWQYLLHHRFWVEPPIELPEKIWDDPAFMAQWLSAGVRRFDNIEMPALLSKREALFPLKKCLDDKMDRDKRKFGVKEYKDIPYQSWELVQSSPEHFDAIFELPLGYLTDDNDVSTLMLTPLILRNTIIIMMNLLEQLCTSKNQLEPLLFADLFVYAYFICMQQKTSFTSDEINEMKLWKGTVFRFVSDSFSPILIKTQPKLVGDYVRNEDGHIQLTRIDNS
ncbi:hypothetical protein [Paenibacillus sp. 276b]|uniref:hypothetical protein n=1 Tax=Paenibacillus sp. 276b TaxID=1566277 RepID=UPI00089689AC|nr:hypothetical protein [Paenibacillus sp. 276b]SEB27559.1 hypothetical protein SAMN03159332_6223 [Paenibacillus sp. 276b]